MPCVQRSARGAGGRLGRWEVATVSTTPYIAGFARRYLEGGAGSLCPRPNLGSQMLHKLSPGGLFPIRYNRGRWLAAFISKVCCASVTLSEGRH